jgi:NAD-dependent deacetylase
MEKLISLVQQSKNIVVFTGAGMSTESGLKDFRGTNGLWEGKDPMKIASIDTLNKAIESDDIERQDFLDFYTERIKEIRKYRPHEGHHALARLHKQGIIKAIITQNTDGYHEKASKDINHRRPVIHRLHGSLRETRCTKCNKRYSEILYPLEFYTCDCGGLIRPGVVLFGENLSEKVITASVNAIEKCDLLIVLGTSLKVSPANDLVAMAKNLGAKVAIINAQPTPYDDIVDLVINDSPIGEVLLLLESGLKISIAN